MSQFPPKSRFVPIANSANVFPSQTSQTNNPFNLGNETIYRSVQVETPCSAAPASSSWCNLAQNETPVIGAKKTFESLSLPFQKCQPPQTSYTDIPPQPVYVEPTSFERDQEPHQLLIFMSNILKARSDVDCRVDSKKFCIKGILLSTAEACEFRIHLFRATSGKVLVEFQRRCGCPLAFSSFLKEMRTRIENGTSSFDGSAHTDPQFTGDVVAPLLEMAVAPCLENAREGLALLAHICLHNGIIPESHHIPQLLTLLAKSFDCADGPIRAYAARLLHALSKSNSETVRTQLRSVFPVAIKACQSNPAGQLLDNETVRRVHEACTICRYPGAPEPVARVIWVQ